MKRFLMLVAVATVAGAMYVAAAPGSQQSTPTAKQFTALKKQVTKLSKTVSALKKDEGNVKKLAVAEAGLLLTCMSKTMAVDHVGDSAGHTYGFVYSNDAVEAGDTFTAALVPAASTDTNAIWFVGGDSTCQTALQSREMLRQHAVVAHRR